MMLCIIERNPKNAVAMLVMMTAEEIYEALNDKSTWTSSLTRLGLVCGLFCGEYRFLDP
jgi:hypothetical protein